MEIPREYKEWHEGHINAPGPAWYQSLPWPLSSLCGAVGSGFSATGQFLSDHPTAKYGLITAGAVLLIVGLVYAPQIIDSGFVQGILHSSFVEFGTSVFFGIKDTWAEVFGTTALMVGLMTLLDPKPLRWDAGECTILALTAILGGGMIWGMAR
ncbi:MAG: hypothetical protein AB7F31_00215 [Parachlamydiales bacterium]